MRIDFNPKERYEEHFDAPISSMRLLYMKVSAVLTAQVFIEGADFSHWNGDEIDYPSYKGQGFDFVFIKATESDWFVDDRFERNWNEALANNIIVMPYHFFRGNVYGGTQLNWFRDHSVAFRDAVKNNFILWSDVETKDDTEPPVYGSRLHGFHTKASDLGWQSGNYSSKYKWDNIIGYVDWANDFWQWAAHWTPADSFLLPVGWSYAKAKWHQYGIYPTHSWVTPIHVNSGATDMNKFYGTLEELQDIIGVVPLPPDCCDEVRDAIVEIRQILTAMNEKVDLNDSRITNLEHSSLNYEEQIALLFEKMDTLDEETFNSRVDIDVLKALVKEIETIFCKKT